MMNRALLWIGTVAVTAGSLTAGPAMPSGTDPYFGDGGTSAFYTWAAQATDPGIMLREERVGEGFYTEHASVANRILYSSTDGRFGRGIIEASGLLYLPHGSPPAGGWPLAVWGHGTMGIADVCAPSWKKPTERDGTYVDRWLQEGFAVVAPDYQGLGTPGVHPYIQRKPEGYSVLDAARAALSAYPDRIANRIVLTGQSQGSGAVLNATALKSKYAPELNILGTIATALAWRSASDAARSEDFASPDSARYTVMRIYGGALRSGSATPDRIITSKGAALREAARQGCSRDLVPVLKSNGIDGPNAFNITPSALASELQLPSVPPRSLRTPVFIGTGLADSTIATTRQFSAVEALCRAGNHVVWRKYDGVSHSATSHAALDDALDFARTVLKGAPVASDCRNLTPPGPLQSPDPRVRFGD